MTPKRSAEITELLIDAIQNSRDNGNVPDILAPKDLAADIHEKCGILDDDDPEEMTYAISVLTNIFKSGRYEVPQR